MMSTAPTRRWYRFSLRTMFVAVTVLALPLAWIAWSLNWIHQRHEFLKLYGDHSAVMLMDEERNFAPRGLWMFGEVGIDLLRLDVSDEVSDGEQVIDRAKRLFPEAEFHWSYQGISDQ